MSRCLIQMRTRVVISNLCTFNNVC